ncbi:MAG: hypothetical protein U0640_14325 [Phycisphaerales bacterium]
MQDTSRRRVTIVVVVVILLLLLLLLSRCLMQKSPAKTEPTPSTASTAPAPTTTQTPTPKAEPAEVLSTATIAGPARVTAGTEFQVTWTGPDNAGDFVTIVPKDAPPEKYGSYINTKQGATITLTAPMDATGSDAAKNGYELRYVTGKSRTILARAAIEVMPAGATIDAPDQATVGTDIEVKWTGPNNQGDYITVAAKGWPDEKYGNYTPTTAGSPLRVKALADAGDAELRYVSGQGRVVLARRAISLKAADIAITAPDQAVAGSTIEVAWTGPNTAGDYITVVEVGTADDKNGNYTNTTKGTPLPLLMPVMNGKAELRYVMGQGRKVLARRAITLVPAEIKITAPDECKAGEAVSITWTGPNFGGDYITIVPQGTADGKYAAYKNTTSGSPMSVNAPKEPGEAEIRYASGQGGVVLARKTIMVK